MNADHTHRSYHNTPHKIEYEMNGKTEFFLVRSAKHRFSSRKEKPFFLVVLYLYQTEYTHMTRAHAGKHGARRGLLEIFSRSPLDSHGNYTGCGLMSGTEPKLRIKTNVTVFCHLHEHKKETGKLTLAETYSSTRLTSNYNTIN
jgi:hypothetical protein